MFDELIPFVMVLRNKHNIIHLYLLVPLPLTTIQKKLMSTFEIPFVVTNFKCLDTTTTSMIDKLHALTVVHLSIALPTWSVSKTCQMCKLLIRPPCQLLPMQSMGEREEHFQNQMRTEHVVPRSS